MSFQRDTSELEGALLPHAQIVYDEDENAVDSTLTTAETSLPEATALPGGVFRSNEFQEGAWEGRLKSQEEIDAVRRESQRAAAIEQHTRREINEANMFARQRNQAEESGATQTSLSLQNNKMPENEKKSNSNQKNAKQNKPAGYQFGSYKIGQGYDVKSYDVNEYKSVYD